MSRKHYPRRLPHSELGIRAQELRTLSRKAWWARRWISALEALRLGPRLGRGRQYAMLGQVLELNLDGSHVEATVAGSRPEPYHVTMDFTALSDKAAVRVGKRLKAEPMLVARTLAGDLPTEVEDLFRKEDVPLFPSGGKPGNYDIVMKCTCPDWAKPCKHMIAILFLLGEEVSHHPVTLLSLRGLSLDAMFPQHEHTPEDELSVPSGMGNASAAGDPAAIIRRLGPIPYWRGVSKCVESLAKITGRVHETALAAAEGKSIDLR